jgi:hypothetical protein
VYDYLSVSIVGIVSEPTALERLHDDNDFLVFFFALQRPGLQASCVRRLAYLRFYHGWVDCTVLLFGIRRLHKLFTNCRQPKAYEAREIHPSC